MYCPECGAKLADNVKFCAKCGAEQTQTQTKAPAQDTQTQQPQAQMPQVQMQPQMQMQTQTITLEPVTPVKKPALVKIISIVAAAVVVLGLGAAGFIFLPRLLGGSKPNANNCIAVTLDALENMAELSGFTYDIKINDGNGEYGANGYLSLGKDLYSSLFEFKIDSEDDYASTKGRAVFYNGFLGVYDHSVYPQWDEEYESYQYIDVKEILEEIFDMASEAGANLKELGIDINNFVKDGRFNVDEFNRIGEKVSKNASDYFGAIEDSGALGDFETEDFDISKYLDKLPAIQKELGKLFENFLYVECEKETFLGGFVSGPEISKAGDSTTYKYSVNPVKLAQVLSKYIIDNIARYPECSALLEDFADSQKMTLDELLSFVSYSLRTALEEMGDGENEIRFSLTVSKKRLLEKFSVSFDIINYDWDYNSQTDEYSLVEKPVTVSVAIKLSDHNNVKPDKNEIESFMKKAEQNADNY